MRKGNEIKIIIPPLLLGIGLGTMFYLLVSDKQLSSFALKAGGHGGHGSGGGHGSAGGHSSGHSSHSSHNASHSTHATHHAVHNVTHPAQHHHEMHTQHEHQHQHQHQHHHHDRPEKKMDDPKIKKLLPLKIKLRYCKPGVDPGCG